MATLDQRLAKIEQKDKAIKVEKKKLLLMKKNEELSHLASIGKICEKIYGKKITPEQFKNLEALLIDLEKRGGYFAKALQGEPLPQSSSSPQLPPKFSPKS